MTNNNKQYQGRWSNEIDERESRLATIKKYEQRCMLLEEEENIYVNLLTDFEGELDCFEMMQLRNQKR